MRGIRLIGFGAALLGIVGCTHRPPAHPDPTTTGIHRFSAPRLGVSLDIPDGWQPRSSADFVLLISPKGAQTPTLSLDVPDLPAHLPGWIPLKMVKDGYLEDLKTHWPGATVREDRDYTLEGAKSRWVRTVSADGLKEQSAVLMVHGDRVYILRADGAPGDAALRQALDQVLSSLTWQ